MIAPCWPCKGRKPRKRSPASRRRSRAMRFMDARIARDRRQRLPRDPVGLYRRGRLRDQRCRFGSGAARAPASGRCFRCTGRSRRPRQLADRGRPLPLRRGYRRAARRRSKRRWNGRCRKFAGPAARAPADSPARTRYRTSSMSVRGGVASACGRSIECRFAAAPCCLPGVPRPSPSARSHPAASDLRRPVRSPWVMCRTRSRRPGRRLFAEVRGNRVPVEVTDLPFVPHRYKRTNSRSNSVMLKFTPDHEWLRIDGDVAVVGITPACSGAARRSGLCRAAGIRQKLRKRRAGRSGGVGQGGLRRLRADHAAKSSRPTNRSSQILRSSTPIRWAMAGFSNSRLPIRPRSTR